jgi:pimeloyl-ACP methyl ester carboxylesterase
VRDFAADVVLLFDALGIEQAVVAGHSGSCLVARRVAIDHPERVTGLVLEASPFTLRDHEALNGFVESVVSNLHDPIDAAFARSFVTDTSADTLGSALVDELTDELLKVSARVWQEMFAGLLAYDDVDELQRNAVPTLLLWVTRTGWWGGPTRSGSSSASPAPSSSSTTASATPRGGRTRRASPATSPTSSPSRLSRDGRSGPSLGTGCLVQTGVCAAWAAAATEAASALLRTPSLTKRLLT